MENFTTTLHNQITMDGVHYNAEELFVLCHQKLKNPETPDYQRHIFSFLLDWINPDIIDFTIFTSGSTGAPKPIKITKKQMIASAKLTADYFQLKPNDAAVLCLPVQRIAGKMMLVRSLVVALDLFFFENIQSIKINPKTNVKLAAFTPAQLAQILLLGQEYAHNFFKPLSVVILGGSPLNFTLKKQLLQFENTRFYQTFAMTETVSHIAICALTTSKSMTYEYELLPNIEAGTDNRGCLWVRGAVTDFEQIFSNDLVRFSAKNTFIWKGRYDNVVNSGGIKLLPEVIEGKMQEIFENHKSIFNNLYKANFFLCATPHPIFGEQLTMIIETADELNIENIKINLKKYLTEKYEVPKQIFLIKKFAVLESGKLNKKEIVRQTQLES